MYNLKNKKSITEINGDIKIKDMIKTKSLTKTKAKLLIQLTTLMVALVIAIYTYIMTLNTSHNLFTGLNLRVNIIGAVLCSIGLVVNILLRDSKNTLTSTMFILIGFILVCTNTNQLITGIILIACGLTGIFKKER